MVKASRKEYIQRLLKKAASWYL